MNIKKAALKVVEIIATLFLIGVGLFALYVILIIFVYTPVTVPTTSMLPGIQAGDKIIVEKVSGGARLYDIFEAAAGKRTDIRRTPHWRRFRRDDVLVFNFVHRGSWDTLTMNYHVHYIKRCIAAPGDTVAISSFRYIVNGDTLSRYPEPDLFARSYPPDSVCRAENLRGYMADVSDTLDRWTIRDFGPLVVPCAGMTLPLDPANFRRYRQIIERETEASLEYADSIVRLDGNPLTRYTFRENYYFMAGDNALASMDSRYWGLVPEDFIVGRAAFIWWSANDNGIQWRRIFKSVK